MKQRAMVEKDEVTGEKLNPAAVRCCESNQGESQREIHVFLLIEFVEIKKKTFTVRSKLWQLSLTFTRRSASK